MSSKIVKSLHVVKKEGQKLITLPNHPQFTEEQTEAAPEPDQLLGEQVEIELAEQKAQIAAELAEWKNKEQAQFLLLLEEEKKRGYQEGYQNGFDEGKEHANLQYRELIEHASAILEQAFQEKQAVIQEAEPFVIALSVEIAKKVLQQELQLNQEALLPMIKQSLSSVYETTSLTISVAPSDFSLVQKQREQLLSVVNGKIEIKIVPDYSVQQGGCMIHTSSGSVDARIDVQLSEIKKALLTYQQELETSE
ncbi:FliH/SctL family protein [Neobacillus novalis]|uniref:FliH/SctL family protein n=1 Tax=Neobacillus novalis TaxID=220687 RepID=A0AA95SJ44_9BACI|nr:FliH/SctL family protein [Neobacillus novalis]WHY88406.1 FliH/SctL family protein [Neobacillus novalis]